MIDVLWLTAADPEAEECRRLREEIFVREQGFRDEFDEIDGIASHLLLLEDGAPVAAARVFPEEEGVFHVGRICVRADRRGSGLGRRLLLETERFCRERGGRRLVLGAQVRAAGFYEACGYARFGAEYLEEFCPHVGMGKDL